MGALSAESSSSSMRQRLVIGISAGNVHQPRLCKLGNHLSNVGACVPRTLVETLHPPPLPKLARNTSTLSAGHGR